MFFNNLTIATISPDRLKEKIQTGEDFFLLDVRMPGENAVQAIQGSYLIPLQELEHRMHELPKDKEIVAYCRVGARSAYAGAILSRQGYNVKSLEGGIMLWNRTGMVSRAQVL